MVAHLIIIMVCFSAVFTYVMLGSVVLWLVDDEHDTLLKWCESLNDPPVEALLALAWPWLAWKWWRHRRTNS